MKWLGSGMQARFLLAMGGAMVVVVAILAVLLGRQAAMQGEVRNLSGGVIHEPVSYTHLTLPTKA